MVVTFDKGELCLIAQTDNDRVRIQRIYDHAEVAGCGFLVDPYRIDHVTLDIKKTKNMDVTIEQAADKAAVDHLVDLCHIASVNAGWWTDATTGGPLIEAPRIVQEKLLLVHSELSEAMEGYRKDLNDDKLPHRKMLEVELADACIRIFDLAGAMNLDLGGALVEKMNFNRSREDHRLENRMADGGKKF